MMPLLLQKPRAKLRRKYLRLWEKLELAVVLGTAVLTSVIAWEASRMLGVSSGGSFKDQSHGLLWIGLLYVGLVLSCMASLSAVLAGAAAMLRRRPGWTEERIRRLVWHSEVPPHWLRSPGDVAPYWKDRLTYVIAPAAATALAATTLLAAAGYATHAYAHHADSPLRLETLLAAFFLCPAIGFLSVCDLVRLGFSAARSYCVVVSLPGFAVATATLYRLLHHL